MTEDLLRAGSAHLSDIQSINRELIEKTLHMHCLAHLHSVKSNLLTQTILSLSESKQEMRRLTADLNERTRTLLRQRETIQRQRDELAKRNREYAKIFQATAEALVIADERTRITEVNPAFTQLTGFTAREVAGRSARCLFADKRDTELFARINHGLKVRGEWQGEVQAGRKDSGGFHAWLTITTVTDAGNAPLRYVGVFSDITRLKASEAQLDHLAHHDPLTGLPNRLLFNARLDHALSRARREKTGVAVIVLDLDHFKTINDSYGHPIGDQLLQQVGRRLRDCVREEDSIARISGDEFLIILEDVEDQTGPGHVAEKLLDSLRKPFEPGRDPVYVSASIGISLYPGDGSDVTTLVRNADAAMYRAKDQGRNAYRFYTEEMTNRAFERLRLETHLRSAGEREELHLCYQPLFDMPSGRPVGLEVLARWRHPELGVIPPEKFIPIAEECGIICTLGTWVIRKACAEIAEWRAQGLTPCPLAINLSVRQLDQGDLSGILREALQDYELKPQAVELEITETALMQRPEYHSHTLQTLKDLGVKLAIDDFGTGYSSLAYLKRFPVDRLKIDHSFVSGIPGRNDEAIIRAIVAMSHSLGLEVVAEGVETRMQRDFLHDIGCDQAQGFLYCEPLTAEQCKRYFRT